MDDIYENLQNFYGEFDFQYFIHISIKLKYIYFEIPKTGCTTIKNLLIRSELGNQKYILNGFKDNDVHMFPKNSLLLKPFNFSKDHFNSIVNSGEFLKFAFLRDPRDRFNSAYFDKVVNNSSNFKILLKSKLKKYPNYNHYLSDINVMPIDLFADLLLELKEECKYIDPHFQLQEKLLPIQFVENIQIFNFDNFSKELIILGNKLDIKFDDIKYGKHQTRDIVNSYNFTKVEDNSISKYINTDYMFLRKNKISLNLKS